MQLIGVPQENNRQYLKRYKCKFGRKLNLEPFCLNLDDDLQLQLPKRVLPKFRLDTKYQYKIKHNPISLYQMYETATIGSKCEMPSKWYGLNLDKHIPNTIQIWTIYRNKFRRGIKLKTIPF